MWQFSTTNMIRLLGRLCAWLGTSWRSQDQSWNFKICKVLIDAFSVHFLQKPFNIIESPSFIVSDQMVGICSIKPAGFHIHLHSQTTIWCLIACYYWGACISYDRKQSTIRYHHLRSIAMSVLCDSFMSHVPLHTTCLSLHHNQTTENGWGALWSHRLYQDLSIVSTSFWDS